MLYKQSQTSYPLLFELVSLTTGLGLTGLTATVTISKNGGSFATPAGAVTEVGSGWYAVAGNATDTNTLGPLIVNATAVGAIISTGTQSNQVVAFDPGAALATPTNITAGTITNVTNLTNAPTSGDLTATMKASVTTAATAATPTAAAVTNDVGGKVLGGGAGSITGIGVKSNVGQFGGTNVTLDANNLPSVNVADVAGSVATPVTPATLAQTIQIGASS